MFSKNLRYKLLALGIAIVIWAYINESQGIHLYRKTKQIPLEVRKVEAGLTVASAPETIKVTLEGPKSHVNDITADPESIGAYVNMHGKRVGHNNVPVVIRLPNEFSGVVNATADPKEVDVVLDGKIDRVMDVGMQFLGSTPVGYKYGLPVYSPEKVTVSGTSHLVTSVAQVVVMVNASNPDPQKIDSDLPVVALDKDGKAVQGVETNPEKVHLRLDLLEAPAGRNVFVDADLVGQPAYPYLVSKIEVTPETITISGKPEKLMGTTAIKAEPINLAGKNKSFSQKVKVIAPQGLAVTGDKFVTVRIEIVPKSPATAKP